MYSILVVGAGYLGGAVARHFKAKKQRVSAIVRSTTREKELLQDEVLPVVADLTQPETLQKIPPAQFIVICPAPDRRDETGYRQLYVEGIGHFLEAIRKNPRPHLIVYISSTSVWKDRDGGWLDETIPPDAETSLGKILIEAEEQILNSGYPSCIFRLSGIYGPGRNRLRAFRDQTWPKREPDKYMNMIHLEDIVGAMPTIFKSAEVGKVYLGVDDEPVRRSEFCRWLSQKTGVALKPDLFEEPVMGKRCRNEGLKTLGVTFRYPTFREGYEAFFERKE